MNQDQPITSTEVSGKDALLLTLTGSIVSAHLSRGGVPSTEIPGFIGLVHSALAALSAPATPPETQLVPAVNPKQSVKDDYIICLEDGKKFKSLKRHLMTHFGLTPEQYREKWGLASDYPMVAPSYAAARSRLAKEMGLGTTRRARS